MNIEVDTINLLHHLIQPIEEIRLGMNGIHLDGAKVTGFKSGLLAQFTGNALQKDDKHLLDTMQHLDSMKITQVLIIYT